MPDIGDTIVEDAVVHVFQIGGHHEETVDGFVDVRERCADRRE